MDLLIKAEAAGRLKARQHPELHLVIWNYTDGVNRSGDFDPVTRLARALVTDYDGHIIARSFSKFFNQQDPAAGRPDPSMAFAVQEKLDGSLILLFHYKHSWQVASRGAFEGPHVKLAKQLLSANLADGSWCLRQLCQDVTYVMELIHPANKLAVDYKGQADLVMLAAFMRDGQELFPLPQYIRQAGFTCVQTFTGAAFQDPHLLSSMNWGNAEGFVIRYEDGTRVKIKFAWYLDRYRMPQLKPVRASLEHLKADGVAQSEGASTTRTATPWQEQRAEQTKRDLTDRMDSLLDWYEANAKKARGSLPLFKKLASDHPDQSVLMKLWEGVDFAEALEALTNQLHR